MIASHLEVSSQREHLTGLDAIWRGLGDIRRVHKATEIDQSPESALRIPRRLVFCISPTLLTKIFILSR